MILYGWGNYPKIKNKTFIFNNLNKLKKIINQHNDLIFYGNGRSYGDSSLNNKIIKAQKNNFFITFDKEKGSLYLQSGVLLSEILELIVPNGWFLKITPGTKLITIGGAIASDVHGKNHHKEGCFSECVEQFRLMLPNGDIMICSSEKNSELFKATCGGMGLTGIILDAHIRLKRITSSTIEQTTVKTRHLKETFDAFEQHKNKSYSVAWIDCLAKNNNIGRCLLMVGDFANDGKFNYKPKKKLSIPFYFPCFSLNTLTVTIFNWLYYQKVTTKLSTQSVDIDTFFYPLDNINHWNRIYGKKGFVQYQFILPKARSLKGLEEILTLISNSGKGSFLAVLKLYGKSNANYLSFPMEGYSLALDFKIESGLFEFLNQLDKVVLKYQGRIYLAKDSRVSQSVFEQGYPKIDKFRYIRKKYNLNQKFNSLQSKRIGL
ncbi:MAG: FAD-binding oxidoreductase [Methylococcales bacterium]|nr:FAD-binding oxidoreductase [Methylococcales bacterium]